MDEKETYIAEEGKDCLTLRRATSHWRPRGRGSKHPDRPISHPTRATPHVLGRSLALFSLALPIDESAADFGDL